MTNELIEQLAAIEHERWADWQKWVHQVGTRNPDGSLTIPAESVSRWDRQIATPYAELSEREKESDREQVRRYLHVVEEADAYDRTTWVPGAEGVLSFNDLKPLPKP